MRKLALIVILVSVGPAGSLADDLDAHAAAEAHRAAEELKIAARATGDDSKYIACGQAYLDLFNRSPQSAHRDELLYNAGVCFEEGKSIGIALQMYQKVLDGSQSRIAPRALSRMAKLYADIGSYAEAAKRLDEYARKYAGEKDAFDALSDAVFYWRAVGDDAKQLASTQWLIRTYSAKKPRYAADAMYSLLPLHERQGPDAAIKFLRDYIRTFGPSDRERTMLAHLRIGQLLWQKSCPTAMTEGLCIKTVVDRATPAGGPRTRCGSPSLARVILVPRTTAVARHALVAFTDAVKLAERWPLDANTPAGYAHAMAKLALADAELEVYLGSHFPTGLHFDATRQVSYQRSTKRFQDWMANQQKLGGALTTKYESVLHLKDASASIAATARLGQITQAFWRELLVSEISNTLRTGQFANDKVKAYCDKMIEVAEPLAARAATAYQVCLDKAAQLGVHDQWSRLCAREGHVVAPDMIVPVLELFAEPSSLALPITVEPPIAKRSTALPDLAAALERFEANDKARWTEATCRDTAKQFTAAKTPGIDELYMAALSLHRCGLAADAKRAYDKVLASAPDHAPSRSNLSELRWRAGERDAARASWAALVQQHPKLYAARVNLAVALHVQISTLAASDPKRAALAGEIRTHLTSALALGVPEPAPLVMLAITAIDARDRKQYEAAKLQLHEARRRDDRYAPAMLAAGMLEIRRGEWTVAFGKLDQAVTLDPSLAEAQLAVGLAALRVRRYDLAAERLAKVQTQDFDAVVARGVAARGLANFDAARAEYERALKIDPSRPDAHYNLGLLDELFVAPKQTDAAARKIALLRAVESYERAAKLDKTLDAGARATAITKTLSAMP